MCELTCCFINVCKKAFRINKIGAYIALKQKNYLYLNLCIKPQNSFAAFLDLLYNLGNFGSEFAYMENLLKF